VLNKIGLANLIPMFREQEVDMESFLTMTDSDLIEIGSFWWCSLFLLFFVIVDDDDEVGVVIVLRCVQIKRPCRH
jgi:hypothetical protein